MHLYRDLSAALPLRTPRCLHAAVEAADGWYVLLLEDLGDARPGDEDSGCSTVDLAAALRAAARMHAAFWQSPRLAELVWLRRPVVPKAERGTVFLPMLERVAVRLGADLSPALLDHLALVAEAVARGRAGPRGPHTLVHGDFSPKNMVFRDGEEGAEVVIFDWQQAASGSAARDVAPLIVLGLPPERLRVEADALLRLYHAALREAGVDRWSFDQLLRDYRAELLQRMIAAVGLAGTVAEPAPTRLTTARRLLERAQIALEGFDPLPLLTGAE